MGTKLDAVARVMPRAALVFALGAAAVPVAVALAILGRGSITHFSAVFLPAVLLSPLLALAAIGLWLFALRTESETTAARLQWASAWMVGLFAIAVVTAPSYIAGLLLNHRDVRAARSYCMMLVPRLEAYKEKAGGYPASVGELLPDFRSVPRLLSSDGAFYRPVGAGYEFVFADPSGWESGHYYFSDDVAPRGHWETWD